eukprot:scaffold3835_cov295-Chaetoceros_neogracile.AAC.18
MGGTGFNYETLTKNKIPHEALLLTPKAAELIVNMPVNQTMDDGMTTASRTANETTEAVGIAATALGNM